MKRFFNAINRSVVAVLVFALALTACGFEDSWSPYTSQATLRERLISFNATTISGETVGDPSLTWSLQVEEGADFCTPLTRSGLVQQPFSLKFPKYDGANLRTAVVKITFSDGYTNTFTVRQLAKTENPDYDRVWGEQPEEKEGSSLVHKTYYTTLMTGEYVRNYSVCYDTKKLVSHWVAYPLHSTYMQRGSYKAKNTNGRTDAWAFDDAVCEYVSSGYRVVRYNYTDPVIPQTKQWPATSTYGGGYARGHILPSASRYNTFNTNAQTFYSTNIMPQNYDFNGGSWVTIESKVRGWVVPDTLFVVTGTLFEGSTRTLSKGDYTVTVPSHAYKLLLRTKKGNTKKYIIDITSADELQCIAFLYENNKSSEYDTPQQAATTVAEIERRTGFKFFRNLNPAIADKVKSQKNLKDWGL